jgi:hypothetical protein
MKDSINFKNQIAEAKQKFADNKDMMAVLEEMEADISLQSRVTGTLLTVLLCEEEREG